MTLAIPMTDGGRPEMSGSVNSRRIKRDTPERGRWASRRAAAARSAWVPGPARVPIARRIRQSEIARRRLAVSQGTVVNWPSMES